MPTAAERAEHVVAIGQALEVTKAQRDEALDSVQDLVRLVQRNGVYLKPEDQAVLRYARAVLAAAGRRVP